MKKFILKRFLILLIFAVIAGGITFFITYNSMPGKIVESSEEKIIEDTTEEDVKTTKTVSLAETYDLNDLKITEYTTILKGKNTTREYYYPYENYNLVKNQDVEIPYFQIDGLTNESVETSINYALQYDVETKVKEILESEDFESNLYVYSIKYSNFANTISVYYLISYNTAVADLNYSGENFYIAENFDLNTGNRINLNDIILNTSKMRSILSSKLYNSVISSTSELNLDENDFEYTVLNYNDIEEEIASVIYKFQNGEDINFSFDEKSIYFFDYDCYLLYKDFVDCVTIYDKFSENYLYDGKYSKLKNIPTLVSRTDGEYQIVEEGENYIIDVTLLSETDGNAIAGETSKITDFVDEKVQEMRNTANSNSNTFYIFNCSYDSSESEDNSDIYIYENYNELQTSKTFYKNKLKSVILNFLRDYPEYYYYESYLYGNTFLSYSFLDDYTSEIYEKASEYTTYKYDTSSSKFLIETYEEENAWNISD